ncbi:ankyrin repeat domain-containing protein [Trinickia dinghuensis]|nr:ankyrin repeat domain-containing protein [Trinickia dinghuensis]
MPRLDRTAPLPYVDESTSAQAHSPVSNTARTQAPPASARPARGTVKERFEQMVNMRKIPQTPALKVDGWSDRTALEICEGWRKNLVRDVSIPQLSRLLALNFERTHPEAIPADRKAERLLPEGSKKDAYYEAMVESFLRSIGASDDELRDILESFKKTGLGGLHRQRAVVASTINGTASTLQYAVAAHPYAKLALYGAQLLLTTINSRLAFTSAKLRFRNSGTEELMPLGRADAAPSAKAGPSVISASAKLVTQLGKIKDDVSAMESALAALEKATEDRPQAPEGSAEQQQADKQLRTACEDMSIAFAAFCLRSELKSTYKAASESAKIEFRGNEISLYGSYANGTATLAATLLAIFAPSSVVTLGATAAAAGLGALVYAGYQLSSGPSKDGEAKAKRAIVALSKSMDMLGGNAAKQQKARADAYRAYLGARRSRDPETRAQARGKLLEQLETIAQGDTTKDDLQPLRNWEAYADHRKRTAQSAEQIKNDHQQRLDAAPADEQSQRSLGALEAALQQQLQASKETQDAEFTQAHGALFNTGTVIDGWKTPYRMRFDSMGRLLLGKVSASVRSLLKLQATPVELGRQASIRTLHVAGRRQELKACLRDWINFETAQARLKETAKLEDDDPQLQNKLGSAARALAAIRNPDAQALFSGDGRQQVEATKLAKSMTVGEEERYTMTMGGATAFATLVNTSGTLAGLGLNIDKVVEQSHGIHLPPQHFGDQKDGQTLSQGSAPFTAHYSAGERARFQKTEMNGLRKVLAREGDPVKLALDVPHAEAFSAETPNLNFKELDEALDGLVGELETRADIADEITFSIGGAKIASGKLDCTTEYYKWRQEQAPLRTKAALAGRQAGMVAKAAGISVASPFVQAAAQIPLARTRKAARLGDKKSVEVREKLTALANERSAKIEIDRDASNETRTASPLVAKAPTATPAPVPVPIPARISDAQTDRGEASLQAAADAVRRIPMFGEQAHSLSPLDEAVPPRRDSRATADAYLSALGEGGGERAARAWLAENGIEAVHNSGNGLNCLIISLLQHATGRYGREDEGALADEARRYRDALVAHGHGEIMRDDGAPEMLHADEPAVVRLLEWIQRDHGKRLALNLVMPEIVDGPDDTGRHVGLFRVPPRDSSEQQHADAHPIAIVQFGNHFEALRAVQPSASFSSSGDDSLFSIDLQKNYSLPRTGGTSSIETQAASPSVDVKAGKLREQLVKQLDGVGAMRSAAQAAPLLETLREAIEHDALDAGWRHPLHGWNLMHVAAAAGDADLIRSLRMHGVAANVDDDAWSTPLHLACENGNTAAAAELLSAGVNANMVDRAGSRPLHWAARSGDRRMIELLVRHGADVDARHSGTSETAAHLAARDGKTDSVRALLAAGANPLLEVRRRKQRALLASLNPLAKPQRGETVRDLLDRSKAARGASDYALTRTALKQAERVVKRKGN